MALNSHTKNYKEYRLHVRATKPPLVPQIGIISRDLFGLEENNQDFVPVGTVAAVNLVKARLLEKITGEMLAMQQVPYAALGKEADLAPLLEFFAALPDHDEKELYARSLALEPREEP